MSAVWLLVDADDHRGTAHESRVTAFGPRGELDLGHLPQQDVVSLARRYHQVAQVIQAMSQADVADQVLPRVLIDEPATGVGPEFAQGAFDVGDGDTQAAHHQGIGCHTVLPHLPTHGNDLRDAGDD